MTCKQIVPAVLLVLAIALLVASLWKTFFSGPPEDSQDFPEGTKWLCKDCGKGFSMSIDEVNAYFRSHSGASVPCGHCGKLNTVRARQCPSCGAFFERSARGLDPKQSARPACPKCGKALRRLIPLSK